MRPITFLPPPLGSLPALPPPPPPPPPPLLLLCFRLTCQSSSGPHAAGARLGAVRPSVSAPRCGAAMRDARHGAGPTATAAGATRSLLLSLASASFPLQWVHEAAAAAAEPTATSSAAAVFEQHLTPALYSLGDASALATQPGVEESVKRAGVEMGGRGGGEA